MKKNIIFSVVIFLLVVIIIAFASLTKPKKIDVVKQPGKTRIEGLFELFPNSSNKGKMVFDNDFVWVANGAGLVRYDKKSGEQKVFTEADGLLENSTIGIIKYGDEIWVASQSAGISILNTKNYSWRYFTVDSGLINESNLDMRIDGDTIWLATFKGFAKYDVRTGKWTNWREWSGIEFSGVNDFVFDENFVWIFVSPNAYTSGGVFRLDKKTLEWTDLEASNNIFSERQLYGDPYLYLDNGFFYAISQKKIYRQDIASGQWESFENNSGNLKRFHIGEKRRGDEYWGFDDNKNIFVLKNSEKEIIDATKMNKYCPVVAHDFADYRIAVGYEKEFNFDGDVLWFGCRQGFVLYDLTSKIWSFKETKSNYPAEVYEILAAKDGILLADTNLGLGLIEPETKKWNFIKSLEANDSIWDGVKWDENDIYFVETLHAIGSGEGPDATTSQLWKYNVVSKTVNKITDFSKLYPGRLIDFKTNNSLWLNGKYEIAEFDIFSGEFAFYKPELGKEEYFGINEIKKKGSDLWFVSNLGLGIFDAMSKKFEIVGNPPDVKTTENLAIVGDDIFVSAGDSNFSYLYSYNLAEKNWRKIDQAGFDFRYINELVEIPGYLLMTNSNYVDLSKRKHGDAIFIDEYDQYSLNVYDVIDGSWKSFSSEDGMIDGEIKSVCVDEKDVWLSNYEFGFWKLNIDKLK